jgi:hypothetical protein
MPIILDGTNGETFPSWTTAGRPSPVAPGQTGYNTTLNVLETYNGTAWDVSSVAAPTTTGNVLFTTNGTSWSSTPKITSGTVNAGGTNPFPGGGGPIAVDFTGIPAWTKRITVMLNGVSTNGTSPFIIQLGSTTIATIGYSGWNWNQNGTVFLAPTYGIGAFLNPTATNGHTGTYIITNISGNTWQSTGMATTSSGGSSSGTGSITLTGVLDRLKIIASSTGLPVDTFDAGSINIMYE